MKQEAEFTRKVKPWLLENVGTGAYEIKHTRGEDKFRMAELKEHQKDFLSAVRSRNGMCFKIPDDGVAYKPFDMFCLQQEAAWVVIAYPDEFYVIDALKLVKWTLPYLSQEDARLLASLTRKLSVL